MEENKLNVFLEANIDEAADHLQKAANEAKEKYKQNLREPINSQKIEERMSNGYWVIRKHLGEYANDRLCLIEMEKAAQLIESTPPNEEEGQIPKPLAEKLNISAETLAVFYKIGTKLADANEIEEAIAVFTFLSMLDGFSHEIWLSLGLCHLRANEWIPAIKAFTMAAFFNPDKPSSYIGSIECYLALQNKENASSALHMAKTCINDENKATLTPIIEHYEGLIHQLT